MDAMTLAIGAFIVGVLFLVVAGWILTKEDE